MMSTKVLKPSGTGFEWCINQYHGCAHGCLYCYGMTIGRMNYADWIQSKPRKDVIQNLQKDIHNLRQSNLLGKVRDIFVGSVTDSYQPLELEHKLTGQIIEILIQNELPFTILTKSNLILRDIDLLKSYKQCRAGITLTSLDDSFRKTLEPGTGRCDNRIQVLQILKKNGIQTYVSVEPIMPVREADPIAIVQKVRDVVDLFEFGKWSKYRYSDLPKYYWENYSDEYYYHIFARLLQWCNDSEVNYCIASHSEKFFEKCGLPFKPYPLVKEGL